MRIITSCTIVSMAVCFFLLLSEKGIAMDLQDLQQQINLAQEGEVVMIPPGEYEGSLVIDKPVIVQGNGKVTITNKEDDYTLFINSDQVRVTGLTLRHQNGQLASPALLIKGSHNVVEDVTLYTSGMGIMLEDAHHNVIYDITIEGPFQSTDFTGNMFMREGNGIDLFQSHANVIASVSIQYVKDGVYIEQSDHNTIRDSKVLQSRYGFHLMFTQKTNVVNNVAEENIAGAMVMSTVGTTISQNYFRKQKGHVHSIGMMLYDVQEAIVKNNVMSQNLMGLYIESSKNNTVQQNQIIANYIGVEMIRSKDNTLKYNDFMNNMISARAKESVQNKVENNFWDDHKGLDVTGKGVSVIPYTADILFPAMIAKKPAYQIFADSPGMFFLQLILDVDREETFVDQAPLMKANRALDIEHSKRRGFDVIICSFVVLLSSLLLIVGGRKH